MTQENQLVANQAMTGFSASRILVFAPHPDDEVFGCGGALALAAQTNAAVRVIVATDGALGSDGSVPPETLKDLRENESKSAAKVLGYPEPIFWGFPDRGLAFGLELVERIKEEVDDFDPALVIGPSWLEVHPDHRAISQALLAVAEKRKTFDLAMYEVGHPLRTNYLIDISSVIDLKRKAMQCFTSQEQLRSYARAIEALNSYRVYTLNKGEQFAEAFYLIDRFSLDVEVPRIWHSIHANDMHADPFAGYEGERVSVVVPSAAPTEFFNALVLQTLSHVDYLAWGSYSLLPLQWQWRFSKTIGRAGETLQELIARAQGDWLVFLSGAWALPPDFFEKLIALASQTPPPNSKVFVFPVSGEHDENDNGRSDQELLAEGFVFRKAYLAEWISLAAASPLTTGSQQPLFEDISASTIQELLHELVPLEIRTPGKAHLMKPSHGSSSELTEDRIKTLINPLSLTRIQPSRNDERLRHITWQLEAAETRLREERLRTESLGLEIRARQWTIDHIQGDVSNLKEELAERRLQFAETSEQLKAKIWEASHLAEDLAALKAQAQLWFNERNDASLRLRETSEQSIQLRNELTERQLACAEISERLQAKIWEAEHLSQDLSALKTHAQQLFEERNHANRRLDETAVELSRVTVQLDTLQSNHIDLLGDLSRLKDQLAERQCAYAEVSERLRAKNWEAEHLSQDLSSLKTHAQRLFDERNDANRRLEETLAEFKALRVALDVSMDERIKALTQLYAVEVVNRSLDQNVINLQKEVEALDGQLKRIHQESKTLEDQLLASEAANQSISSELSSLLQAHTQLELLYQQEREQLQQSRQVASRLERDVFNSNAWLEKLSADLSDVQADARSLYEVVQSQSGELDEIKRSRAWRFISRYRRIRAILRHPDRFITLLRGEASGANQTRASEPQREVVRSNSFSWANIRAGFFRWLRRALWLRLSSDTREYLRPYTHLMRGAFWLPQSSQNLPALQALQSARSQFGLLQEAVSDTCEDNSARAGNLITLPWIDIQLILYQSERWMADWVRSLFAQTYPLEQIRLVVIDHNPGDGSARALREALETAMSSSKRALGSVEIIEQENLGFSAGHNRALKSGTSPFVLAANPDLEFEPNSIQNVVERASQDPSEIASWELRQKPFEHPKHYDPVTGLTNWSSHACVLLRRSAVEAIGGWDDRLFMYCEDVAMSFRLRESGYLLRYCPDAVVWHHSYGDPTEVKRAQYIGTAVGHLFIRLRFGLAADTAVVPAILLNRIYGAPQAWRGELWRKSLAIVLAWVKLRLQKRRAIANAHRLKAQSALPAGIDQSRNSGVFFPFRGLDFELRREGAFFASSLHAQPYVQACGASRWGLAFDAVAGIESMPKVTIITRTYPGPSGAHRLELLKQAAASVLRQTWRPLEWIVVEDGALTAPSSDDDEVNDRSPSATQLFCMKLSEQSRGVDIRYLASPPRGRSFAGNLGLSASSGEWICFLDDDDLLYADHLESLLGILLPARRDAEASGATPPVAAYGLAFDVPSRIVSQYPLSIEEGEPVTHPGHQRAFDFDTLLEFNYMPIQSVVFQRSLFVQRGGFDPALDQLEDWNLWVRYAFLNRFVHVAKTTSIYRTPLDTGERLVRQKRLDEAYAPVREINHAFCKQAVH